MSNIFNNWNSATSSERLDLVFENRNRAYGAYKIRKEFSKNQILAMLIAVGFAFLLSGGSLAYNIIQAKSKPKVKPRVVTKVETIDDIEEEEEEEPEKEVKTKEPEPDVATEQYVTPTINESTTQDQTLFNPEDINTAGATTQAGVDDLFNDFDPTSSPINTGGNGDDGSPKKVAIKAKYPGGDEAFRQFIQDNFIYPLRCKEENISGYVELQFIVDKLGNVSNVVALDETKSCPEFTTEAKRVIKLSKWIPGQNNGQFFASYRKIPIALSIAAPE